MPAEDPEGHDQAVLDVRLMRAMWIPSGPTMLAAVGDTASSARRATTSSSVAEGPHLRPERNLLYGGPGPDRLYGGNDRDRLYGEVSNNWLFGEAGIDWLFGGSGRDVLDGGTGDNHLESGDQADEPDGGCGGH
jgi:Ca2+-binding RTX toxin-like protein